MKKISNTYKTKIIKSWWFPVWKGLIIDSNAKHRKKMGTSIWLYLYLLFSTNRRNGTVSKKQKDIAEDLGLTVRTIQKHLFRLRKNNYIQVEKQVKTPKITITKYKVFNQNNLND
jgi:DNA-binding MarR family transcriptional regulator